MGHHPVVFRNDMPTGNEPDTTESGAAVTVLYHIAKLDEGVPVPVRLKTVAAQILEPSLIKEVQRIVIGIALLVDKFERARHYKSHTLLNTAGEVRVNHRVTVYVKQPEAVRIAYIDSRLPSRAPFFDVALRGDALMCGTVPLSGRSAFLPPPFSAWIRCVYFFCP